MGSGSKYCSAETVMAMRRLSSQQLGWAGNKRISHVRSAADQSAINIFGLGEDVTQAKIDLLGKLGAV